MAEAPVPVALNAAAAGPSASGHAAAAVVYFVGSEVYTLCETEWSDTEEEVSGGEGESRPRPPVRRRSARRPLRAFVGPPPR
jgi:hypothetical protein